MQHYKLTHSLVCRSMNMYVTQCLGAQNGEHGIHMKFIPRVQSPLPSCPLYDRTIVNVSAFAFQVSVHAIILHSSLFMCHYFWVLSMASVHHSLAPLVKGFAYIPDLSVFVCRVPMHMQWFHRLLRMFFQHAYHDLCTGEFKGIGQWCPLSAYWTVIHQEEVALVFFWQLWQSLPWHSCWTTRYYPHYPALQP